MKQEIESRFHSLRERWKRETLIVSSATDLIGHPAYQEIIEMGAAVLPLIFQELRDRVEPDWWFYALRKITGANPVPPEHAGRLLRMSEDWLDWANENGFGETKNA